MIAIVEMPIESQMLTSEETAHVHDLGTVTANENRGHDANLEKALLMSHALPFFTDTELLEIVSPLKQPAAIVRWFGNRSFMMKVKPPGLQSINVDGGHYRAAFLTSPAIGATNLALFKLALEATEIEIAAYFAGGSVRIVCTMKAHPWLRARFGR
jgi:hypothetical protein